jgi:hypothetical protein
MTLASAIITDAYRETNIIPMAGSPSSAQTTEALTRLNAIILTTLGYEVNDQLRELNVGGDYDQSEYLSPYVPDNVRLVLNLTAARTVTLSPKPYDGQRFAILDTSGNLATYNLTIDGNGRNIEGSSTLTVSTSSTAKQWMYRADTGNWVVIEALDSSDEMPFPVEFDDYFVLMLAYRINPRYGQELTTESGDRLRNMRSRIRARYGRKDVVVRPPDGLVNPRDPYYQGWNDQSAFDDGALFPWM